MGWALHITAICRLFSALQLNTLCHLFAPIQIIAWAGAILNAHAERKSVLEVRTYNTVYTVSLMYRY